MPKERSVIKFPIPENESLRLRTLHGYGILDSPNEVEFDRITELASLICKVPMSMITLVDDKRQWFKSKIGIDLKETSREQSFCQYAIMDSNMLEVQDATLDERFQDNNFVKGNPQIRFYAGYPLVDPAGLALGALCVLDRKPKVLNAAQSRSLKLLADEVITLIVERRQKEELRNFEKLFQLSEDLICVADLQGNFLKTNPSFQNVLGWNKKFFLSCSFSDLVHQEDIPRLQADFQKMRNGQNSISFSYRFKTKKSGIKILQWTASTDLSTGHLFAIARDITKNKANERLRASSEEKLRAFFQNSQSLMCTHDLQGKFLSINTSGAFNLGYTPEEMRTFDLYDIVPVANHALLSAYLKEIETTGIAQGKMMVLHKNGSPRIWMYNNVLERNGQDKMTYVIGNAIDITERHFLEHDLRRTKEMLEQTNTVAHVGGWEADVKEQKLYWTSVTKDIHQVAADYEPNLAEAIAFYKDEDHRTRISKAVQDAMSDGTPFDLELQIINKKEKEIWVRVLGNADFENGVCKRVYGAFQDIDEKKKGELEIHRSKKLLEDVLQGASSVCIIATDEKGLISVFNSGAENLLGYTAEEMIGKCTPALLHDAEESNKRSRELSEELGFPVEGFRIFVTKAEREGSENREWTFIRKDGCKRIVSLVVCPMRDIADHINGYLGIAIDITQSKYAENALIAEKARLSAFVEHAPAAVAMLDRQMHIIAASRRWIEEYEMTNRKVIGESYYTLFPHIEEIKRERHLRVLNGAIETNDEDEYIFSDTGRKVFLSWQMRPWFYFNGEAGGIMISTQNITTIINQREELKVAKQNAERASLAKSEFLTNMSHEIRTPLNGVIGFTDLVLKTRLNATQQQYLSIVSQSANTLLSIINDILDFSKIEAGKLELDIDKCDLYEVSCQASDMITFQAQTKGLEMLLNIPPDLPRFIWADHVRLKQILVNLLGNSAKFTEKGEIELKIEALSMTGNQAVLRFSVRDTGIGIKTEKQDKIFEAFSQEDGSTTKKYGGSGLGLTISNKLLGLMGSQLMLQSTPGQGSLFYFDLLLTTERGDAANWDNIEKIKDVLIVDDNDNNRLILQQIFLLKNIHVHQAKSGMEAVQLISEGHLYDVIFMDYLMPEMDGLETIKRIRNVSGLSRKQVRIILLHSSPEDRKLAKACEELNVIHRFVKPIKIQDVFSALTRAYAKEKVFRDSIFTEDVKRTDNRFFVLVAEDNEINMLLVRTIIRRIAPNAVLLEAKNGLEAVAHCEKQWPDLIFMDIQMPDMNGYEATTRIRNMEAVKHVPIIALTAGNIKGEMEKCLAAGMDDFLIKPAIENTLAAAFDKWLSHISRN